MSQKYLYLSLDLLTILVPLLLSFYPKANFSKKWKFLLPAILLPGLIFLLADEAFTRLGVWGFNPEYLSGLYVGSLPLEEILFFICIPYACLFTYDAMKFLIAKDHLGPYQRAISIALIVCCLLIGTTHFTELYTTTTFLALAICLTWLQATMKEPFLGRLYFAYLILVVPFLVVNGILTGSGIAKPVVWYNNDENLGLRLGSIPVEDAFYWMLLMVMNVWIFEWLQRRWQGRAKAPAGETAPR